MILDGAKIKHIKAGPPPSSEEQIADLQTKMDKLINEQEYLKDQLGNIQKSMFKFAEKIAEINSNRNNGENVDAAIRELTKSTKGIVSQMAEVSVQIASTKINKSDIDNLAKKINVKTKNNRNWDFDVVRDTNGRIKTVKAKQL